jgi:hypothetical protein
MRGLERAEPEREVFETGCIDMSAVRPCVRAPRCESAMSFFGFRAARFRKI